MLKFAYLCGAALCVATPASSAILIGYEASGAINTTVAGSFAVEGFEQDALGFHQTFADTITDGASHAVTFSYTDVAVRAHDQFSGAGTGNYGATYNGIGFDPQEGPVFSLDVASTGGPINFFGAYFSATDASNTISFYKSGSLIQTFTLGELWGSTGVGNQGNLYVDFKFSGGQTYDSVIFNQPISCCGFESDNHTVGTWRGGDDNSTLGVPEPASWALMLSGFGLIGATMRRRRTSLTFA
jgi:hypothetical protein